jgi:hypothetical protein
MALVNQVSGLSRTRIMQPQWKGPSRGHIGHKGKGWGIVLGYYSKTNIIRYLYGMPIYHSLAEDEIAGLWLILALGICLGILG